MPSPPSSRTRNTSLPTEVGEPLGQEATPDRPHAELNRSLDDEGRWAVARMTTDPPVFIRKPNADCVKRHFEPQRHLEFKELMLTKLASVNPLTKNAPGAYFANHTLRQFRGSCRRWGFTQEHEARDAIGSVAQKCGQLQTIR